MSKNKHARMVMEFLSAAELKTSQDVKLEWPVHYDHAVGLSSDDVMEGLAVARRRGWVLADNKFVHLTETGYVTIGVANGNPPEMG